LIISEMCHYSEMCRADEHCESYVTETPVVYVFVFIVYLVL